MFGCCKRYDNKKEEEKLRLEHQKFVEQKNIEENIEVERLLKIQNRSLYNNELTYEEIKETVILRVLGLNPYETTKNETIYWLKRDIKYYPFIGDLIAKYFNLNCDFLLDILKEICSLNDQYDNELGYPISDNYSNIYNQIYSAIVCEKDHPHPYIKNTNELGMLKTYEINWSNERALKLLKFIIDNNLFKKRLFIEKTHYSNIIFEYTQPLYYLIYYLIKFDIKNIDILAETLDKSGVKFTEADIITFFYFENTETVNKIFQKFNTFSKLELLNYISKININYCYIRNISILFDNFYDKDIDIKNLDEFFVYSCLNDTGLARVLNQTKILNRKYKIYIDNNERIAFYRICYF